MDKRTWYRLLAIAVLVLVCTLPGVWAAPAPAPSDYTTTYTINLQGDGSALWTVEYRTPIQTDDDLNNFQNYSSDMNTVYLPQLEDLMQGSAAQAATGTGRPMVADNFSGNAIVQTSPTGRFGVVTYSFSWTNFSVVDSDLSTGDAFVGGLYLDKDSSLIITYPQGYSVTSVEPVPDQQGADSLIWYGERSFEPGQPQIVLAGSASPILPVVPVLPILLVGAGIIGIIIVAIAGFLVYRKRRQDPKPDNQPEEPEEPAADLSEADRLSIEERIVQQLKANAGEQFQSEIVKSLGMPKSTVSSALNDLQQRGIIQKVKKGRENLIRLITTDTVQM
ncbi:DUF7345 domain-containing protein [Methanoregula sp.]|uniref:DUF7345 domain-containing protein n=1 Tax=Methanoregula sp. TaxID=2052170 RepID=UPI003C22126F